jgi:hypothetical protein
MMGVSFFPNGLKTANKLPWVKASAMNPICLPKPSPDVRDRQYVAGGWQKLPPGHELA